MVVERNPRVFRLIYPVVPVNFKRTSTERRANRSSSSPTSGIPESESLSFRSLEPSLEVSSREENLVKSLILEIRGESVLAVMITCVVMTVRLRSESVISGRMPLLSLLDSANEYPSLLREAGPRKSITLLEVGVAVVFLL